MGLEFSVPNHSSSIPPLQRRRIYDGIPLDETSSVHQKLPHELWNQDATPIICPAV